MGRGGPYSGTTIGGEMENAIKLIDQWQQITAATMTEYTPSTDATIRMLFDQETIDKATAARGIVVKPFSEVVEYNIRSTINVTDVKVRLGIDYTAQKMIAIREDRVLPQPSYTTMQGHIAETERIYRDFEEVKGLLRWLNGNASLKAIRAYFPPILKLCPNTFRDLHETPTRYQEPYGIENWLQAMRNATNTIAGAQMLPVDAEARKRVKGLYLTFLPVRIAVGEKAYTTDQVTFNL